MKIINPSIVTAAELTTNVANDALPTWVSGTNYDTGDQVIFEGNIYEDLGGGGHGAGHTKPPPDDPEHWLLIGAVNPLRMFDGIVSSVTTSPMTIDATVRLTQVINGAAFFGLKGSTLTVTVTDDIDGLVYEREELLQDNSAIVSWYAYFFEPIIQKSDIVLLDLPNYRNADVRAVIDAGAGEAQVGEMVVGTQRMLGVTNFGTSVSIQDYSRKERDQFGNVVIVERRFSKRADFDVTVDTPQVSAVQTALAQLRATPVVYVGDENRPSTAVYGFYRNFNIVLSNPSISDCTIEVEGLV